MITVIANLKGGSGKSTVSFNLGIWLEMHGLPVVAYDLDPQCTLSDVAQVRREEGFAPPLQVYRSRDDLAEHLTYHPGEVLVDVGAASMADMKIAIGVADRVLIPVPPSQPDVWATQRFLSIVKEARQGREFPEMCAFVNRADTNRSIRESDETAEALEQLSVLSVLPERIYNRTIYRRSLSEGLAVFEMWPNCKAAEEIELLAQRLYPELVAVAV
jgi:chromosome partitioning protein